jgi:hypothetical protein
MPVELPISRSNTPPAPPKPIVWLVVFVVIMLAGGGSTLLGWPKTEPTGTAWFWMCLLDFPALGWCILFGLRLHYYNEEMDRQQAEDETREVDRAEAIRFASEPLAVLGYGYLSALGSAGVASGQTVLHAETAEAGKDAVRRTVLTLADDDGGVGRYRSSFMELLGQVADAINAVPRNVPFNVRLELPLEVDQALLVNTWQACWRECEFRPADASLCSTKGGAMELDGWLDIRGGPELEKFTLFVSVQLHHKPLSNSAEAAVALLLGWAPLVERSGLKPLALLHRPVEVGSIALNAAVSLALLWGKAEAMQLNDLWQAGLEGKDKSALVQAASDLSLGISKSDQLSGIHDIDVAIGDPGVAAGWLALVLAIEHAAMTGKPQLMATGKSTLRLAVAQPATGSKKVEWKG